MEEDEPAKARGGGADTKGLYALRVLRSGAIRKIFVARMAEIGRGISEEANQAVVVRERSLEVVQVMDGGTSMVTLCEYQSNGIVKDAVAVWPKVIGKVSLSVPVRGQTLVLLTDSNCLTFLAFQGDRARLSHVGETLIRRQSPPSRKLVGHQLCSDPANGLVAVSAVEDELRVYQCIYAGNVSNSLDEQPLRQVQALILLQTEVDGVIWSCTFVPTKSVHPVLAVLVVRDDRQSVWIYQMHIHNYVHIATLSTCATTPQSSAVYRMTSKLTGQTSASPPPPPKATSLSFAPGCPHILLLLLEGRVVVADLSETLRAANEEVRAPDYLPLSITHARRHGLSTQPLLTAANNDISYLIVPHHTNFELVSGSKLQTPLALVTGITHSTLSLRTDNESMEKVTLIATDHGDLFALLYSTTTAQGGATLPGSPICFGIQSMGRIGSCSSLAGLADNMFIVTSDACDGSIRNISFEEENGTPRLEVRHEILNMAPITDFCFSKDMKTLYTCGGMGRWGNVRAVRNGTGVQVHSSSPPHYIGCHSVWPICSSLNETHHSFLVLSFVDSTCVFRMEHGKSMVDYGEQSGFLLDDATVAAGLIGDCVLAQVYSSGVRLLLPGSSDNYISVEAWACEDDQSIVVGVVSPGRIAISISQESTNCFLVTLVLRQGSLVVEGSAMVAAEISCIEMWDQKGRAMIAIGTHTPGFEIRSVDETLELLVARSITSFCSSSTRPDAGLALTKLHEVELIPESIVVVEMAGELCAVVGLRNGYLIRIELSRASLEPERVSLRGIGQRPVHLAKISMMGSCAVMALSDSSLLLFESRRKITAMAVSTLPIESISCLSTKNGDNALIGLQEGCLQVLSVKNPSEISTTKFPLKDTPSKMFLFIQDGEEYLAVSTSRVSKRDQGRPFRSDVRILKASSGSLLAKYTLEPFESVHAIAFWQECVVVGTGYDVRAHRAARERCPRGRLLLFGVASRLVDRPSLSSSEASWDRRTSDSGSLGNLDQNLRLRCEVSLPGAVLCITPFQKTLLATANEQLFAFVFDGGSLVEVTRTASRRCIVSIDVREDDGVVLVADEKDSLGFLSYRSGEFVHEYWDHRKRAITDSLLLNEKTAAAVDKFGHFLTLGHRGITGETATGIMDKDLQLKHSYNMGSVSAKLQKGCLRHVGCLNDSRDTAVAEWGICAATLNGEIVSFSELSQEDFALLRSVEEVITVRAVPGSAAAHDSQRNLMPEEPENIVVNGGKVSEFARLDYSEQLVIARAVNASLGTQQTDRCLVDRVLSRLEALSGRFFALPTPESR